mmetsp:Transcript_64922/g.120832  ORF Transcript_64922/g.120832 Transcript_64922/m.120832 type:complete len:274 (-) Transcript_64922:214-1035(-)
MLMTMAMRADACNFVPGAACEAAPRKLAHLLPLAANEPAFITCEDGKLVVSASCHPSHSLSPESSKASSPGASLAREAAAGSAKRTRAGRAPPGLEATAPRDDGVCHGGDVPAPAPTSKQDVDAQPRPPSCSVGQKPADDTAGLGVSVPALVRDAEHGETAAVTSRLAAGEDPDSQDDFGLTALHSAARKGHLSIVEKLLDHGAQVNKTQYRGETALHYACKYGHTSVVRTLLGRGSDIQLQSHEGRTPKQYAEEKKRTAVLEVLAEFSQKSG